MEATRDPYKSLKNLDYGWYVRAIEIASALCINIGLDREHLKEAAKVERTIVDLVLSFIEKDK